MHRIAKLIQTCSFLAFFAFSSLSLQAQSPSLSPAEVQALSASQSIQLIATQTGSDLNYLGNHQGGNGNANQMMSRMASLGQSIQQLQPAIQSLNAAAAQIGTPGILAEAAMFDQAYAGIQVQYRIMAEQIAVGIPVSGQQIQSIDDGMSMLREAGGCIRREIQEIQQ